MTVLQARTHTPMARYAHPTSDRYALLTDSAALLLYDHLNVEDIRIWITHVEGAMPPRLGRQFLDPFNLEAFEPHVLPVYIRDFQL